MRVEWRSNLFYHFPDLSTFNAISVETHDVQMSFIYLFILVSSTRRLLCYRTRTVRWRGFLRDGYTGHDPLGFAALVDVPTCKGVSRLA